MFSSFSKKNIVLSTAVILSLGLIGCGGGSSGSGATASAVNTGVFADAPVVGLSYNTLTQSGFTDASGQFKYQTGETVEFKLGTLSLGKGTAGSFMTPYDISSKIDNNVTATNIALLLQNFDGNRTDTQILDLSKLKDHNFTTDNLNISEATNALSSKLTTLLATGSFQQHIDNINHDLIAETAVKKNMDDYINKYETEHTKVTTPTTTGSPTTDIKALLAGKTFHAVGQNVNNLTDIWGGDVVFNQNLTQLKYTEKYAPDGTIENNSIKFVGHKMIFLSDSSYTIVGVNKGDYIEFTDYTTDGSLESHTRLYFDKTKAIAYVNSL